jgi:hypothetical protein
MDTMYHQAPAYEMHAQAIEKIDENRIGFEDAYERALAFCNLLEQPEFFEQFNENEIKEIRNMIIHLALRGASDEDRQLIEQDIMQFFADDDEEGIFNEEDLFSTLFGCREDSSASSLDFYSIGSLITSISL